MLAALAQNWRARAGIARLSAHPREIEDAMGSVGGTIGISCLQAVARRTSTPWFPDEAPSYIGKRARARWRSCSDRRSGATLSIRFAHFETCRSGRCGLRRSGLTREFTTAVVRCRLHPARIRNARTCAKMRCSNSDAGWSSPVARWAHNPKVAGSNPAPATIDTCSERSPVSGDLLLCTVAPSIARDFPSGRF